MRRVFPTRRESNARYEHARLGWITEQNDRLRRPGERPLELDVLRKFQDLRAKLVRRSEPQIRGQ